MELRKGKPLVSVVIPCYNHEKYVQECIRSVIEQDYENIELIVIDDGSKDGSVDEIKKIIPACQARFKRFEFRYRANKGLCATLNEALDWCEGVYLSCIASDDVLLQDKTSFQVDYLESHPGSHGVFGGVEVLDSLTGRRRVSLKRSRKNTFSDIFTYKHHLPAPTQMLRRSAVKGVGGFREDLIIEDWSMWLFLTEKGGTLDYVSRVFAVYRRHEGNFSSKLDLMSKGRQQILELYKDRPEYKKAYAMAGLVGAHDVQTVSKQKSYTDVLQVIKFRPATIFSKSFLSWFVKQCIR
jgi:alpha-1,3-rhamnosyltransferase